MKLNELKNLILCDLIIDTGKERIKDVWKEGPIFKRLSDKEIIGLRTDEHGYLIISVR